MGSRVGIRSVKMIVGNQGVMATQVPYWWLSS
jgi:hypothetical protein